MQVHGDDGKFHRQTVGGRCACTGEAVNFRTHLPRHERLDDQLCELCFAPWEIAEGKRISQEKRDQERAAERHSNETLGTNFGYGREPEDPDQG